MVLMIHRCPLTTASLVLFAFIAGCAGGFRVVPTSETSYPPSDRIAILTEPPDRPYQVVAEFSGTERRLCVEGPYCSLIEEAKRRGAQAVWITRKEISTTPDQWILIDGHLTRIWGTSHEWIEGYLVRYVD